MMKEKAMAVVFALTLAGSAVFAARNGTTSTAKSNAVATEASTQSTTHQETGKVSSMTSSHLVLSREHLGKAEKSDFILNPVTKREGKIGNGDRVIVYYHNENGKKIATEVKAVGQKSQTTRS